MLRQEASHGKEEFLHSRLTVRQPIAEKREGSREARIGGRAKVRRCVEGIVNRETQSSTKALVGRDYLRAAAVGEYGIEARGGLVKWMASICRHRSERRRRIDIPEQAHLVGRRNGKRRL